MLGEDILLFPSISLVASGMLIVLEHVTCEEVSVLVHHSLDQAGIGVALESHGVGSGVEGWLGGVLEETDPVGVLEHVRPRSVVVREVQLGDGLREADTAGVIVDVLQCIVLAHVSD